MGSLQLDKTTFQPIERPVHPLENWPKVRSRPILLSLRAYPKVAAYCFAVSLSALLAGYDVVIVGSIIALPQFQQDYGQQHGNAFILPSMWLALWSSSTFFGQMAGAILGGWLQDKNGRQISLLLGSVISAAAVGLCYCSYLPDDIDSRRGLFLAGKAVMGIALGMLIATSQTWISETTSPDLRGPALALLPTKILLGQLIGAGVAYGLSHDMASRSYLIALATQWALSLLILVVALLTPESPVFLVTKGRYSRALKSLGRLHTSRVDLPTMLDQVRLFVLHEQQISKTHTYLDCFRSKHRRQTLVVLFAGIVPQLFGLAVLSQASYFVQILGMPAVLSLGVLVLGIILGLVANIIGIWILSKVGRRRLILMSLAASTFVWLGMGITGFWSGKFTMYTSGTFMAIVIINGLGSWPASFAVAGEASSLLLRAKTQGLNWFTNSLFSGVLSIALPYIFNPDAGNLGAKTGFVFAGLCLVGTLVSWLVIPEMKGRDHAEIEKMFELGIRTRNFKSWSESEDTQELRQL
ncbi:Alpha-glucosides permease MPH3-like protein 3 [Seiridium cupressi]